MNEAETRAELIDPALQAAGWGAVPDSRIRRETIAPGRIQDGGRRAQALECDYVLTYRNRKLAVIEAKRRDAEDTEGVGQAKDYASRLQARFAFSTNGRRIYQIDMATGAEGYVESYPRRTPCGRAFSRPKTSGATVSPPFPYAEKGGGWAFRYYQANAVENVLEKLSQGGTSFRPASTPATCTTSCSCGRSSR